MADKVTLNKARKALTGRYTQPYHVNAIMAGDWDGGSLMQAEIEKIQKAKLK